MKCDDESIKCHDKYNTDYGFEQICSTNKTKCIEYKNAYFLFELNAMNPILVSFNHLNKLKQKIKLFNKQIKECSKKNYQFKSKDLCLNGNNCKKVISYTSFHEIHSNIDCKCPANHSFKCNQYCAVNSNACDYYKSLLLLKNVKKFQNWNNHNNTVFKYDIIW